MTTDLTRGLIYILATSQVADREAQLLLTLLLQARLGQAVSLSEVCVLALDDGSAFSLY